MTAPPDTGSGRPLLDRLGVKRGMRVALVAFDDDGFRAQLAERGARVQEPSAGLDIIFFWAAQPGDLRRIGELRGLIHDAGAIWVLREKGAARSVRDTDVIDAGRAFDLVDNKIASFSDIVAAMRLVVPVKQRRSRNLVERERSS